MTSGVQSLLVTCMDLQVESYGRWGGCRPNARVHSPAQVKRMAASLREFGFNVPCLVDDEGELIACWRPRNSISREVEWEKGLAGC